MSMLARANGPLVCAPPGASEPAREGVAGLVLVRRAWGGAASMNPEVIERVCPRGAHHVDVAIELWRLAGWPERARQIEAIVERVIEDEGNAASARSVAELLDLLAGLDDALRESVTDAQLRVDAAALPILRAHTRLLDLADRPGHVATEGVAEAVAETRELQAVLEDALALGLAVRFA